MSNLFSVFDPSTGTLNLSLNWLSVLILMVLPSNFWVLSSKSVTGIQKTLLGFSGEVSLANNKGFSNSLNLGLSGLFLFLIANNFMGLFPYVFTGSSHMVFTLSLSLSMWLGMFTYTICLNFSNLLAHFVPKGTPLVLIPFMVLIEVVSGVMRPFTLGIRLAANMIAGHLLLVLVSAPASASPFSVLVFIGVGLTTLLVLETAVAFIQSYVFVSLMSLYVAENNESNL